MIIGESFKKLFQGMEVTTTDDSGAEITRAIKTDYGDQKELLRWIALNRGNANKYPLVWYPIADVKERGDWKIASSSLIIFSDTKLNYMNGERYVNTYSYIIDPVWQLIKNKLEKSNAFTFIGTSSNISDRYVIRDEPNYGVDARSDINDFTNKSKKGQESIVTDIVDARLIEFSFEINTTCI